MESHVKRIGWRTALCAGLTIALAGCNGNGGGATTAPVPGVPVISSLNAGFGGGCTVQGLAGTALPFSLDFADSDGDLRGGTLQTTGVFEPSGQSIDVNFGLPSPGATISGTTDGTITAVGCVRFGTATAFRISVAVLDTASHSSNILSQRLERPAGVPEVTRGSGGAAWSRAD